MGRLIGESAREQMPDVKIGDVIEAFSVQKVAGELIGAKPQLVHQ